ncbi:MAG TPA: tyrosine decarboxylase MfnA [Methanothermococcus okinawensis]|uniref:Probable L-tyrosine/L-aspartate decarboxylase n=1 Tax=Methanothermococcus okinawensis TaxID=155863 RepID=A0A832ZIE2_9EURY|nr:tyrosine decarboxylase MfnA [Methanothermococcus okinawensis]
MKKEREILEELKKYRGMDLKYEDGRILGSMCTKPHPISRKILEMFLDTNLGDPGLFPGTKMLEEEVIRMIGEMLHNRNPFGYIISGGTEANITAMRVVKKIGKGRKRDIYILIPETAHFSFEKAREMMDLNYRTIPLDKRYIMDVKYLKDYIEDNRGKIDGIVAIAGSTELGTVDNILEISKIAREHNIYIHVDGAFGGFVIPFLEEKYKLEGYNYNFDFSLDNVFSITVDPHKMGLAPIPAGGIVFRDISFKRYLDVEAPYLTETSQATLLGTRTGIGVAATWAIMKHLGAEGYREIVSQCMENTYYLVKRMKEYSFESVIDPVLNIVAIKDDNPLGTSLKLRERGWYLSTCRCVEALRVVVMPHVKREHIDRFIETLAQCKKR